MNNVFHVVVAGHTTGIFTDRKVLQKAITGYTVPIYDSFNTFQEAKQYFAAAPTGEVKSDTIAYTDGSAKDDKAGYGLVIPPINDEYRSKKYKGRMPDPPKGESKEHMHNKAELYAIFMALSLIKDDFTIYCDSSYCISSINHNVYYWAQLGWNKEMPNRYLLKACHDLLKGRTVKCKHIKGHNGHRYNELADKLADEGRQL